MLDGGANVVSSMLGEGLSLYTITTKAQATGYQKGDYDCK